MAMTAHAATARMIAIERPIFTAGTTGESENEEIMKMVKVLY